MNEVNYDDLEDANFIRQMQAMEKGETESDEASPAEVERWTREYPGWTLENSDLSGIGLPLIADISQLTDDQVRTWACRVFDVVSEHDALLENGEISKGLWGEVYQWAYIVMDFVQERLGDHDGELMRYVPKANKEDFNDVNWVGEGF